MGGCKENRIAVIKNFPEKLKIALLAAGLAAGSYFLQADYGINLADEGFLWYGAIQTHLGQVPIRDFQSYDPGRYYWIHFFFSFLGNDLLALRAAMTFFQMIALFLALLAARKMMKSYFSLAAFGFVLLIWMLVPFRHFEYGLPIIAVFMAMRLLEKPVPARHFACGIFTGLAAFFGLNHGVYAFFAFYLLILLLFLKENRQTPAKKQILFFAGIFAGYLPMICLFVFAQGFLEGYFHVFLNIFHRGTNMPLAVPWPWTVSWAKICQALPPGLPRLLDFSNKISTGIFFLAMPIFYISSAVYLIFRRKPLSEAPLWTASVFVGIFYLHHIFSRTDISHLADGMAPFSMGLLALGISLKNKKIWGKGAAALVFLFFLLGVPSAGTMNLFCYKYFLPKEFLAHKVIGRNKIWLLRWEAERIDDVQKIVSKHVGAGEQMLIIPQWPAFYCLLGKSSPIHEIYFLWSSSQEEQQKAVRDLENKKVDWLLFGKEESFEEEHFQQTYDLLWKYLMQNFKEVDALGNPPYCRLYQRK